MEPGEVAQAGSQSKKDVQKRRTILIVALILILIVILCCACLLAVGLVLFTRQGNAPLLEDLLQVNSSGNLMALG